MRCKDIERLLIDSSGRDLNEEKLASMEQHILHCARCKSFHDNLKEIRICLGKMTRPNPSSELVKRTLSMCHAKIDSLYSADKETSRQTHSPSVPKYIWAAFITLIFLTVILMCPLLKFLELDQFLSFQEILLITLIAQNAGMLFSIPLLIHRKRLRSRNSRLV